MNDIPNDRNPSTKLAAPSGLSLSRPHRSTANNEVDPASTPSSSNNIPASRSHVGRPASLLSVSPSMRSVSGFSPIGGNASTPDGSTNNATVQGANSSRFKPVGSLNVLRRVASSATINSASNTKMMATENTTDSNAEDKKHTELVPDNTFELGGTSNEDMNATQKNNIPSDVGRKGLDWKADPALEARKAEEAHTKRRTWFGFKGGENAQNLPPVADRAQESSMGDKGDQYHLTSTDQKGSDNRQSLAQEDCPPQENIVSQGQNSQEQICQNKNTQSAQLESRSWIPWKNAAPEPSMGKSMTYRDSVQRCVSWGQAHNIPNVSFSRGWGWANWRSTDVESSAQNDTSPTAQASAVNAIPSEGGQTLQPMVNNEIGVVDPPAPVQGSFISRWLPWSRNDSQGEHIREHSGQEQAERISEPERHTEPPTPAEKYKAESLARLGAKEAVLNPATRSAWVSYFGTRSSFVPSAKMRDNGEPEVMKLDLAGKSSEVTNISNKQKEESGESDNMRLKADPAPPTSRPMTPLTSDKDLANRIVQQQPEKDKTKGKKRGTHVPPAPNLLLPSFEDVFEREPRDIAPRKGMLEKTLSYLFSDRTISASAQGSSRSGTLEDAQYKLPRHWKTIGNHQQAASKGCKNVQKVTVIGIHGWFSQGPLRNIFGEPTGTSSKFSTMMRRAVFEHFEDAGYPLTEEQVTSIAIETPGKVSERVDKSFATLISNPEWVASILSSDAVFVAAHSQGSIVATHLLARLIEQHHIDPQYSKIVLLCMCGIHNGPFAHLRGNVTGYYLNTFETPAAKELFDYQSGQSSSSMLYAASLRIILNAGVKTVYVASLDDQVVPLYSALHTPASHPSILRAIFCDGSAFPRIDFLTNLLSFCVNVRNAGLWDHNLVTLLSSSVAGSLYGGAGHSLIYEEPQVYTLAVRYLFEVTSPSQPPTSDAQQNPRMSSNTRSGPYRASGIPSLNLDSEFTVARNMKWNSNPYALPWSLRGLVEDEHVRRYFARDISKLVHDYNEWMPVTKTLKDGGLISLLLVVSLIFRTVQFRLEPMRLISKTDSTSVASVAKGTNSKL